MSTEAPLTISTRMREHTQAAHTSAENSQYVVKLMGGELSLEHWFYLLEQYNYIYAALEEAVRNTESGPVADSLFDRCLEREEAIEADLVKLQERLGDVGVGQLAATKEYCDHIKSRTGDATKLLAHHYTRYLGDLSGGQVMRALFQRHYGLTPEEGTFFHFEDIEAHVPYKRQYRTNLDELPLTESEILELLDEIALSYEFNERIFKELQEKTVSE